MNTSTKMKTKTKKEPLHLSVIIDKLADLGWDYSCNRMSRSGMEIYDGIMRYVGAIEETEHWNEDVFAESNGDW